MTEARNAEPVSVAPRRGRLRIVREPDGSGRVAYVDVVLEDGLVVPIPTNRVVVSAGYATGTVVRLEIPVGGSWFLEDTGSPEVAPRA